RRRHTRLVSDWSSDVCSSDLLANFYTPVSGGLRTCVSETGRGYVAAGHERLLVVPGPRHEDVTTPEGRRVTIRGRLLPGSGGYQIGRASGRERGATCGVAGRR